MISEYITTTSHQSPVTSHTMILKKFCLVNKKLFDLNAQIQNNHKETDAAVAEQANCNKFQDASLTFLQKVKVDMKQMNLQIILKFQNFN